MSPELPAPGPRPDGAPAALRLVFHDGRLCPQDEATLLMGSIALRYGISVFEGIRLYTTTSDGRVVPWCLDEHLQRLRHSCAAMGLDPGVCDDVPKLVDQLVEVNRVAVDSYVRVAVSAASPGGIADASQSVLTVSVTPSGRKKWLRTGEGMRLTISSHRRPGSGVFPSAVKNISTYAGPRLAAAAARAAGFDDCVLRTDDGLVCEAPTATVFLVEDGALVTPPLSESVLPGVTRAWVLAVAPSLGLRAAVEPVTPARLLEADEAFLCGTGAEFSPVREIDGVPRRHWPACPVTTQLVDEYFRQARGEARPTPVAWSPVDPPEPPAAAPEPASPALSPVVDWPRALAAAARLTSRPAVTAQRVTACLNRAPVFQNRDFAFSPLPVLLRSRAVEALRPLLEAYGALLGDVVRHYRREPEVRAWFGLPPAAQRLIAADGEGADAPWVCRLDGYLEQTSGRLVVLENNADAPAGTLFTARINALGREIVRDLTGDAVGPLDEQAAYGGNVFFEALLAGAAEAARRDPGRQACPASIAILQPAGAANRESLETAAHITTLGVECFVADARELRVAGGRALFGDRPADLCWNKLNTVAWNRVAEDEQFVLAWRRALAETPLVHLNPFGARYVAENKLALAFVQEPRFASLFSEEQRALAARLLPWTRRVDAEATAPDGSRALTAELLDNQVSYVLKEPYDIRGDGVTIGDDVSAATWRAAVVRAVEHGHIAQQRIKPLHYPIVSRDGATLEPMAVSLDSYLLGGRLAGFGSKAGRGAKVNVFQGGQKLAVQVTAEGDAR